MDSSSSAASRWAPPTRPRVRWGLGDFFLVYFGSIVLAVVAGGIAIAISGDEPDHLKTPALTVNFAVQFGAMFLGVWAVSRFKGNRSLRRDFGFMFVARDWWAVPAGFGLAIAGGLLVAPLVSLAKHENQQVVEDIKEAGGIKLAVLVVAAGLVAPIVEELLFRGLLLRALDRRLDPAWAVGLSGVIFAAVHLTDPSEGTAARLPGLLILGLVSGFLALRSGRLSQSMLLHLGFNLVVVVSVLAS